MTEQVLLARVREFVRHQSNLLKAWRSACPLSTDCDLLLDFPKEVAVQYDGERWLATKHGQGVRFRSPTRLVDVPREVTEPESFEADRVYDYLGSVGDASLLGGKSTNPRALLAELFERWVLSRHVERRLIDGRACYVFVP